MNSNVNTDPEELAAQCAEKKAAKFYKPRVNGYHELQPADFVLQNSAEQINTRAEIAEAAAAEIAALIARLEASGHAVQKNRSGDFLISRWGMSRHCLDMESLRDFAKQVGQSDA